MQNPKLTSMIPIEIPQPPPSRNLKRKLASEFDVGEESWPFGCRHKNVATSGGLWGNNEALLSSFERERLRCEMNLRALKKLKFEAQSEMLQKELREAEEVKRMATIEISNAKKTIEEKDSRIKILERKLHDKEWLLKRKNIQICYTKEHIWSYIKEDYEFRYPPCIQNKINEKWRALPSQKSRETFVTSDGRKYTVDFLSMTQINNKTGFRRRIRMQTQKNFFDGKWKRTWECNINSSSTGWVAYPSAKQQLLCAAYEKIFILSFMINGGAFEIDFNEMKHRVEGTTLGTYKLVLRRNFSNGPIAPICSKAEISKRPISTPSCMTPAPSIDVNILSNTSAPPQGSEANQLAQPNLISFPGKEISSIACRPRGQIKRTLTSSSSISKDGREYGFVYGQFFLSCPSRLQKRIKITRIDAYQDPKLASQYLMMKSQIEQDLMSEGLLNEEMWVYHGTSPTRIEPIMSEGFKIGGVDISKANGSKYGLGVYTSKSPKDPIKYALSRRNSARVQGKCNGMIIMARSIVGKTGVHSWSPPSMNDWKVFRRSEQVMPCYVVHFEFSRK